MLTKKANAKITKTTTITTMATLQQNSKREGNISESSLPVVMEDEDALSNANSRISSRGGGSTISYSTRDFSFDKKNLLGPARTHSFLKRKKKKKQEIPIPVLSFMVGISDNGNMQSGRSISTMGSVTTSGSGLDDDQSPQSYELKVTADNIQIYQSVGNSLHSGLLRREEQLLLGTMTMEGSPKNGSALWRIQDNTQTEIAYVKQREYQEEQQFAHNASLEVCAQPKYAYRMYATSPLYEGQKPSKNKTIYNGKKKKDDDDENSVFYYYPWADLKQYPTGLFAGSTKYSMAYYLSEETEKWSTYKILQNNRDGTSIVQKTSKGLRRRGLRRTTTICAKLESKNNSSSEKMSSAGTSNVSSATMTVDYNTDPLMMSVFFAVMNQI